MPMTLKKFMDKLGVGYELQAYETYPWNYYDTDKDVSIDASVIMNADRDVVEAEITYSYMSPPPGGQAFERVFWMKITPYTGADWKMKVLLIHDKDATIEVHDSEGRACQVFYRFASTLLRGEVPDFDEILKEEFYKGDRTGHRSGGSTGKQAPKINPEQMPGMNRGKF